MTFKIGVSTVFAGKNPPNFTNHDEIRSYLDFSPKIAWLAEMGIKHIELIADLNMIWDKVFAKICIEKISKLKKEFRFTCSVHMPFRHLDISYPSEELAEGHANMLAGIAEVTAPLEPEAYVTHVAGPFINKYRMQAPEDIIPARSLDVIHFCLSRYARKAGIPERMLALENTTLPFSFYDSLLKRGGYSVCMDAGHILMDKSGDNWGVEDFFNCYKNRIISIHLHDVMQTPEGAKDHFALGSGVADLDSLAALLVNYGYKGYVSLEIKDTIEEMYKSALLFKASVDTAKLGSGA